ncbi:MAG: PKD-like domain-containing protein [Ferruginibacter sp.]
MRRLLSILFLLLSSIVSAQKPAGSIIAVKAAGSKFKFVNSQTGIPVNQQLWDETDPFSNGFSRVFLNNKFSFVNDNGVTIHPVEFEDARNFSGNLAAVKKDGKWSFVSETGKIIFPFSYDIVFDFEGSVSAAFGDKKWWLINNNGEVIKPLDISVCYGFKNGMAKVAKDGKEGIMYPNGEISLSQFKSNISKPIPYHPHAVNNNIIADCPDNIDFENGDFFNWECFIGQVDSVGNTNVITVNPSPPTPNRHVLYQKTTPSAIDPYGLFPINPPDGSNFAVKLGNTNVGAQAERIRYTIHVPLNDSNFSIKYDYAVVLQDPGHTMWTQPRFNAKLLDSATNTYIACASFEYISTSNLPGFAISPVNSSVIYKPWASVFFSMRGYGGQTIYLEFTTADCVRRAHWGYAYVDVQSTCGQAIETQYDCNFPNITTLTAPPGFQTYNWWDSGFTTIIGNGQQLVLNPGPTTNSVFWVEMIPFANFGCTDTLKATITGELNTQFTMSSPAACAPHTFTFYNSNIPSTSATWDFGDGNTGTGDTVTHTYTIPGTYVVQLSVTTTSGCNGTASHNVIVRPPSNMNQPPNQNLCNNMPTSPIGFTSTLSGTIYSWTNNNTAIGLAASGTGNIAAFTPTNPTGVPIIATIIVTPSTGGCPGPSKTFTITVKPSPSVVQPPNQSLCQGGTTNAIMMSGSLSNTIYLWTNDNTSIGLGAGGNGNILPFTAINTSDTPAIATITVTPFAANCIGPPVTFTITVNPAPNVVQPSNQSICNGAATNAIAFTGPVNGTTYTWTNSNTSIGLAANGNGNIASFMSINTSIAPVTAIITVTPSAAGCPGTPKTFTITVNPTPNVVKPADQILCNSTSTSAVIFTGALGGATYAWTNNNTSIGLPASGSGNIASFITVNSTNISEVAAITVTPSAFGCVGTPEIFAITVSPTPSIIQPPNQSLCNRSITNAIIFNGPVSGTTYNWTNTAPSIGLPASGSGNIAPFTAYSNGFSTSVATITVRPTASGCPGTTKLFTITINPAPNVIQPPSQALCNGSATNVINFTGGMANTTYNWTNNNPSVGLAASGTGNIPSFTAIDGGNTVEVAAITVIPSTNFCSGTPATFFITIHPTPAVAAGNDRIVCIGSSAQLSATGAAQYTWSPATGLSCTNCQNPVATPIDTIKYIVKGTSSFGCIANDTVSLNVIKPFQMLITPNDTLCIGESTVLRASGANSYLWSPPAGLNRTDIEDPTSTPNVTTLYRVVGYDGHNCFTDTDFVKITVGPRPTVNIGPDLTLSTGSTVQLNPVTQNGPIINWAWTPSAGLSCTSCPQPTLTITDNRYYVLSVTNNYGCISSDTIFIFTFCKNAQVFIPNAFTPDGDGLNDVLMVRGKGIFIKTFRIFSRWGELVFEKTNFNPNDLKYAWDGKIRGVPATPDVFVYTADVICDNGIVYTYKGNSTLLK